MATKPLPRSETMNRMRKAERLAQVLHEHGATWDSVEHLPEAGWSMACELAGVTPASEETRMVVAGLLVPHGWWAPR